MRLNFNIYAIADILFHVLNTAEAIMKNLHHVTFLLSQRASHAHANSKGAVTYIQSIIREKPKRERICRPKTYNRKMLPHTTIPWVEKRTYYSQSYVTYIHFVSVIRPLFNQINWYLSHIIMLYSQIVHQKYSSLKSYMRVMFISLKSIKVIFLQIC